MDESLLKLLRSVDTPTVLNAIEVAQGKRGFDAFTRGTMLCSAPHEPAVVGYAVTAKISGLRPSQDPPAEVRERRMAYYKMMAEAPKPSVAVVEDVDFPGCMSGYPTRACIFVGDHTASPPGNWVPMESWKFISQF